MNNDLISRSEAEKLGATCLAKRNENGQLEAIISLDNAPTVEITEEQAIDKLHETGWIQEHDKQMTERPTGEWRFSQGATTQGSLKCPFCDYRDYHKTNFNFCPNCGADMRKPNCVRCDHFGNCEGCEKGEEE